MAYKMKGFEGFGNSPLSKKYPPKSKRKDTLRPISQFEIEYPKTKKFTDMVKKSLTGEANVKRGMNLTGKIVRSGKKVVNYFRAR